VCGNKLALKLFVTVINANADFRIRKNAEIPRPKMQRRDWVVIFPNFTRVTGSASIRPAFFKPMNVRKIPMPPAVPIHKFGGMALAIMTLELPILCETFE
jgi:hypothetical protein